MERTGLASRWLLLDFPLHRDFVFGLTVGFFERRSIFSSTAELVASELSSSETSLDSSEFFPVSPSASSLPINSSSSPSSLELAASEPMFKSTHGSVSGNVVVVVMVVVVLPLVVVVVVVVLVEVED